MRWKKSEDINLSEEDELILQKQLRRNTTVVTEVYNVRRKVSVRISPSEVPYKRFQDYSCRLLPVPGYFSLVTKVLANCKKCLYTRKS